MCLYILNRWHGEPIHPRELLQETAARPVARPPQPPGLFRNSHVLGRPLARHVDEQVAELVAGFFQSTTADEEQSMRPHVPVVPPEVRVVQPDPPGNLRGPHLAVHAAQVGALGINQKVT